MDQDQGNRLAVAPRPFVAFGQSCEYIYNQVLCSYTHSQCPNVYVWMCFLVQVCVVTECLSLKVSWIGLEGQEMLQGSADGCRKPINLVCVFHDPSFS